MLNLQLSRYQWHVSDCGQVKLTGRFYWQGRQMSANDLVALFVGADVPTITERLAQASGFFSLIACFGAEVYVCSDIVRSYPVFYGTQQDQLWLGDDCACLFQQISATGTARTIVAEYLAQQVALVQYLEAEFTSVGYVCGNDTLYGTIKQLPAATLLVKIRNSYQLHPYFTWQRFRTVDFDEKTLLAELDSKLTAAVDEAIQIADGRQIVVPLSGGYDSRAIVLYLSRRHYANIVTFTFGAEASSELLQAKRLAEQLQLPWHPVIYTGKMWRDLRDDDGFQSFCDFICNGVSTANIQVWPAIRYLLRKQLIASDALVLPGHTGDFVSGAHLNGDQAMVTAESLPQVVDQILRQHYRLDKIKVQPDVRLRLTQQCVQLWQRGSAWSHEELMECWNWQERQSKFIVNSNRYYEFFDLDWWMPLWQKDFVSFWLAVPKQYLRGQRLWRELLKQECAARDIAMPDKNAGKNRGRFSWFKLALNYFFDANLLVWLVPFRYWLAYRLGFLKHSGTVNSYLARLLLVRLKRNVQDTLGKVD